MRLPTKEQVRAAVEEQLHSGLANIPGDWIAILPDDTELQFRPDENGKIEVEVDDRDADVVYKFRIRVEIVD